MKDYVRLNAFELGQIIGASDMNRLLPQLRAKLRRAQARVYLDSGFTEEQVFGDQNVEANRNYRRSYYEAGN